MNFKSCWQEIILRLIAWVAYLLFGLYCNYVTLFCSSQYIFYKLPDIYIFIQYVIKKMFFFFKYKFGFKNLISYIGYINSISWI